LASDLKGRLAALAIIGGGEGGIDRALFTPPEYAARATFAEWCEAAGLTLRQDIAGNLFARRPGRRADANPILVGSHLDTVRGGGAYDGAYGVVAALCALEELAASGTELEHSVEAVAWAGEEGSRFPLGCLGSSAYSGATPLAAIEALFDDQGVTFGAARDGFAGLLPGIPLRADFPQPAAYLELHIEQGPVMERAGIRLGIVTAIAGQRRFEVTITGEAGHAGTVPMGTRHDALCAAAAIVLRLEQTALELGECVVTVGRLDVSPNQTNVIPGAVTFRVDARSVDDSRTERIADALRVACAHEETLRGIAYRIEPLERRAAVPMDARLRTTLREALAPMGEPLLDLPSGAGHDAMCIATIAPTAMVFVPSAGGRSHAHDEFTSPEDLELGVIALARSIAAVDRLALLL
jgi:allantoate deiminase